MNERGVTMVIDQGNVVFEDGTGWVALNPNPFEMS